MWRNPSGAVTRFAAAFFFSALPLTATPAASSPPSQSNALSDVLARAGRYVAAYGASLSTVLAEEQYTQRLVWRGTDQAFQERQLRSELAFITLVDESEWLAFRNVMSVDGKAVRESEGRLERLFRDFPPSFMAQVRLIARESARYNLGPITREINVPTTALYFLESTHQRRCRFEKVGEELIGSELTWKIRYQERDGSGAYITRSDGSSVRAGGHVWIVPADGRVVRTELTVRDFVRGSRGSLATITVTWRQDRTLDLWVPSELRERYQGGWPPQATESGSRRYDIDGVALYSNYRRFTVDVKIK